MTIKEEIKIQKINIKRKEILVLQESIIKRKLIEERAEMIVTVILISIQVLVGINRKNQGK